MTIDNNNTCMPRYQSLDDYAYAIVILLLVITYWAVLSVHHTVTERYDTFQQLEQHPNNNLHIMENGDHGAGQHHRQYCRYATIVGTCTGDSYLSFLASQTHWGTSFCQCQVQGSAINT